MDTRADYNLQFNWRPLHANHHHHLQIIFRKVADLKHEQELDEMQQHQPQLELGQDHIVRRLISKFRKPSDAGAIGSLATAGSSNLLQVPPAQHGGGSGGAHPGQVPTISGQLAEGSASESAGPSATPAAAASSIARTLAGKQSRWSQLVASAAAGAAGSRGAAPTAASGGGSAQATGSSTTSQAGGSGQQPVSATRSLLDITDRMTMGGESSSARSSADGRDDEVDENYFRPGGKGHQALLDNMDKR